MAGWLEKAVIYEIYPKSFYDTKGDGTGDLQGIIEKLDYVVSLGCNGVCLSPLFVSEAEREEDIIKDYCTVIPCCGSNKDMKRLIEAAKARHLKVFLTLTSLKSAEAVKKIMEFWLGAGVEGFKLDMTDTAKEDIPPLLSDIELFLKTEHPEAFLVPHILNMPKSKTRFDGGIINKVRASGKLLCTPTGSPYAPRMSYGRTKRQSEMILTCVFSLPGIPVVYYGDEIGLKYAETDDENKKGFLKGSVMPMQWSDEKNAGFSSAEKSKLFLAPYPEEGFPGVKEQNEDPNSLLSFTKHLIAMRRVNPAMGNFADFKILAGTNGKLPYMFLRFCPQQKIIVAFNPEEKENSAEIPLSPSYNFLLRRGGVEIKQDGEKPEITMSPQSFAIVSYI